MKAGHASLEGLLNQPDLHSLRPYHGPGTVIGLGNRGKKTNAKSLIIFWLVETRWWPLGGCSELVACVVVSWAYASPVQSMASPSLFCSLAIHRRLSGGELRPVASLYHWLYLKFTLIKHHGWDLFCV